MPTFVRLLVVITLLVVSPMAARADTPVLVVDGAGTVLVVDGAGRGRWVGLAQDGADWMGRAGADVEEILSHSYPGTRLARADGQVRAVLGTRPAARAVLTFPDGS